MMPSAAIVLASLLAWVPPDEASGHVETVLEDGRYAFCDPEGDFVPLGGERDFCALLEDDPGLADRCPGFVDACAREASTDVELPEDADMTFEKDGETRDETTLNPGGGREGRPPEPPPEPVQVPAFMGTLAQILLWTLLAVGLGVLIYSIWKNRATGEPRDRAEPDAPPPQEDAPATAPVGPSKIVETDVERLLRLAQEAAQRGDYRTAVDASHAALLRRLDGEGLIEITIDKTNGDYLRQVGARSSELRSELRPIVSDVERVQFGTGEPDRNMFQRVHDRVVPVVRRTVLLFAVGVGLAASLSACDERSVTDEAADRAAAREHAELGGLSPDPLGARAVVQVLRRQGLDAVHRTRTVEQLASTDGTVLVTGEVDLLDEEWDALLTWARAESGHHLVIAIDNALPEGLGLSSYHDPRPLHPEPLIYYDEWGEEQRDEPAPPGLLEIGEAFRYDYHDPLALRLPVWNRLRTADGDALDFDRAGPDDLWWSTLLVGGGIDYAVTSEAGEGRVTVFADSLMFTNVGLAVGDNAAFVIDTLDGLAGDEDEHRHVELVDSWTGTGAQTPLESIQNSHLTPLLLQLLAALILFYWWRGAAFGALRDPPRASRRSFSEHVEALGLQYAKAGASKHALSVYAGFAIERLRERLRPGTGGIYALAQAVAARTSADEAEVMQTLVEMHELRDGKSALNDPREHRVLMRKIQKLLKTTGGAR